MVLSLVVLPGGGAWPYKDNTWRKGVDCRLWTQVDDLVLLSGCCADNGTFLDKPWSPGIRPTVERIEVRGGGGVYLQENAARLAGA
jgi:hypothetical protein